MGIGPRIGGVVLPWLALAVFLTLKFKGSFYYSEGGGRIFFFTGLALVLAGAIMYFLTVPALLKGLKQTRLVTDGTYYLCRHPLYTSVLLLIIPGISLMMNSWLVVTTSILGYTLFKIFIKSEYEEMKKFFGDDYERYMNQTPEFIPFPMKKWFRSEYAGQSDHITPE